MNDRPEHAPLRRSLRLRRWWALAPILLLCTHSTGGQAANLLDSMVMLGTIGSYPVGLNYTTRNHTELMAAHYFYASQLKNIALTGKVNGEAVDLQGADGSTFHLHFIGNGSNGKNPLTFYNSTSMAGTWMMGTKSLPVTFSGGYSTANPGQRIYTDVTGKSDTEFEEIVQAARSAIIMGDRNKTAKYLAFPLRVNLKSGHITIGNAAQLQMQWSRVFPPALIEKLKSDVPHEMFVRNGEAMLGDGELWFADQGLVSVNSAF